MTEAEMASERPFEIFFRAQWPVRTESREQVATRLSEALRLWPDASPAGWFQGADSRAASLRRSIPDPITGEWLLREAPDQTSNALFPWYTMAGWNGQDHPGGAGFGLFTGSATSNVFLPPHFRFSRDVSPDGRRTFDPQSLVIWAAELGRIWDADHVAMPDHRVAGGRSDDGPERGPLVYLSNARLPDPVRHPDAAFRRFQHGTVVYAPDLAIPESIDASRQQIDRLWDALPKAALYPIPRPD